MPFLADQYHHQDAHSHEGNALAATVSPAAFDYDAFVARLGEAILGQPTAVDTVARAILIARAGAADPRHPLASVLLAGPTGVGKTELVRQIASEIRSGPDDICRIDMASLAQEHYAASLSGAPPGYAGSKESFTLFDRCKIEGDAYTPGIVLFDEIEKADPTVIRSLLHVLDHGQLCLANGQQSISFRNCFIFMTSNLGSSDAARLRRGSYRAPKRFRLGRTTLVRQDPSDVERQLVTAAVERFFDPEFFNRIDETVVMAPLDASTARHVTAREVDLFVARMRSELVTVRVDPAVVDFLHRHGFNPIYGARGLRRAIRTSLIAPVAECVMRNRTTASAPLSVEAVMSAGAILATTVSAG